MKAISRKQGQQRRIESISDLNAVIAHLKKFVIVDFTIVACHVGNIEIKSS